MYQDLGLDNRGLFLYCGSRGEGIDCVLPTQSIAPWGWEPSEMDDAPGHRDPKPGLSHCDTAACRNPLAEPKYSVVLYELSE
jgi:hypothetical protein